MVGLMFKPELIKSKQKTVLIYLELCQPGSRREPLCPCFPARRLLTSAPPPRFLHCWLGKGWQWWRDISASCCHAWSACVWQWTATPIWRSPGPLCRWWGCMGHAETCYRLAPHWSSNSTGRQVWICPTCNLHEPYRPLDTAVVHLLSVDLLPVVLKHTQKHTTQSVNGIGNWIYTFSLS